MIINDPNNQINTAVLFLSADLLTQCFISG